MYRWIGHFGPDLHFRGRSIFDLGMVGYGRNEESCLGHFSYCGMVYIEGLNGTGSERFGFGRNKSRFNTLIMTDLNLFSFLCFGVVPNVSSVNSGIIDCYWVPYLQETALDN